MVRAILAISMTVFLCDTACFGQNAAGDQVKYEGKTLSEWEAEAFNVPYALHAVLALGNIGEPAVPVLLKIIFTHPDAWMHEWAHEAIVKIGRPALPALDDLMQTGDSNQRMEALLLFEEILKREAIPRLRKAAQDTVPAVCARALGLLVRVGEEKETNIEKLKEILLAGDETARIRAVESLGWAGAVDILIKPLQDPSGEVAKTARKALKEIGTETAMHPLCQEWAKQLSDGGVSLQEKIDVAADLGRAGPVAKMALPQLQQIFSDHSRHIILRAYAAWAIDKIAPRPAGAPGQTYHVAQMHPNADDGNPGTTDRPWKTIQRAAETLRAGDTVLIHNGTYREFVRPFREGAGPEKLITYTAAPGEKPIIAGSDLWRPQWKDEGTGLWSAPYRRHQWDTPEKWRGDKKVSDPRYRCEQIFVDGNLLVQVSRRDDMKQEENSFFTDDEAGRVWVNLSGKTPPPQRVVERSMRQHAFLPAVSGLGYIRVKELTMRHAAAPRIFWYGKVGLVAVMGVRGGHHWIIEDNTIEWGNAQGLDLSNWTWSDAVSLPKISSEGYHLVRGNRVNHNGVTGIAGLFNQAAHILVEDNETNFNGCKKDSFPEFESAGIKLHHAKDTLIRRCRAQGNDGFGIWLDSSAERCRITQCVLTENMGAGVFLEASKGKTLLADNNVILNTRNASPGRWEPEPVWADGFYSGDSAGAAYINNFISGCEGHGVRLRCSFGRTGEDGKVLTSSHNRIFNNFIFNTGLEAICLHPDVPGAGDNRSDGNIFWNQGRPIDMRLQEPGAAGWENTAIGKALGWKGGSLFTVTLNNWQEHTGNDVNSLVMQDEPVDLLSPVQTPQRILETLRNLWPKDAPALDAADASYGEFNAAQPAQRLIETLLPKK